MIDKSIMSAGKSNGQLIENLISEKDLPSDPFSLFVLAIRSNDVPMSQETASRFLHIPFYLVVDTFERCCFLGYFSSNFWINCLPLSGSSLWINKSIFSSRKHEIIFAKQIFFSDCSEFIFRIVCINDQYSLIIEVSKSCRLIGYLPD